MKKNDRQYRRDGFINATGDGSQPNDVIQPVLLGPPEPSPKDGGGNNNIGPVPPEYDPVEPDPAFEVNFLSLSCATLTNLISQLNTILATTKNPNPNVYLYYKTKLDAATSAASVNCRTEPTPVPPIIGGGIILPQGTPIITTGGGPAPTGGGGGGGGGTSGTKPATTAPKKNNLLLWLLAGSILAFCIYKTRKE